MNEQYQPFAEFQDKNLEKWYCRNNDCKYYDAENQICTAIPDLHDPIYCVPKMLYVIDQMEKVINSMKNEEGE